MNAEGRLLPDFEVARRCAAASFREWAAELTRFCPSWRAIGPQAVSGSDRQQVGDLLTLRCATGSLIILTAPDDLVLANKASEGELCALSLDTRAIEVQAVRERLDASDIGHGWIGPCLAVHSIRLKRGERLALLHLTPGPPENVQLAVPGQCQRWQSGMRWFLGRPCFIADRRQLESRLFQLCDFLISAGERGLPSDSEQKADPRVRRVLSHLADPDNTQYDSRVLTEIACTSQRTLYNLVHEHTGSTPYQLYLGYRLFEVHYQLLGTPVDSTSVSRVASNRGFNHLSRFAGRYRMWFDELPSETLTRRERTLASGFHCVRVQPTRARPPGHRIPWQPPSDRRSETGGSDIRHPADTPVRQVRELS